MIAAAGQTQIVEFLMSDGVTVTHPEPAAYWEVPIAGPMPETFAFIQ